MKEKKIIGVGLDELMNQTIKEDEKKKKKKSEKSDNKEIKKYKEKISKLQKELKELEKILEKDADLKLSSEELFKKGLSFDEKGDFPNASYYYIRALKKDSNNIKAMLNLAAIYYEFDMLEKSKELYQKVLKMDPENDIAKENLKILEEEE